MSNIVEFSVTPENRVIIRYVDAKGERRELDLTGHIEDVVANDTPYRRAGSPRAVPAKPEDTQ